MKINLILGLCTSCAFFYNQYCNQVHQLTRSQSQKQRPDDTDSFTPRVRSDKRSITLLLGKFLCNKDIYYTCKTSYFVFMPHILEYTENYRYECQRMIFTSYRKVLLYAFKFNNKFQDEKNDVNIEDQIF